MASKSVSSTVDEDLFQRARNMTGAGQAETIRRALDHFVASPPAAAIVAMEAPPAAPLAAKPVADMTDDEELASLRLLLKSRQVLTESLVYLKGEEAVADTPAKKRLRIQIGDLEADLAKLNARIAAFQAEQITMVPPSRQLVERVGRLAEEVGQLVLVAENADRVLGAVRQVVAIWTGTQS